MVDEYIDSFDEVLPRYGTNVIDSLIIAEQCLVIKIWHSAFLGEFDVTFQFHI